MSHSIFGWSYPPGCNSVPGDEPEPPCPLCGHLEDSCICPECDYCHSIGDPRCYEGHGLHRNPAQIASLTKQEAKWAAENRAEMEFWDAYIERHYNEDETL